MFVNAIIILVVAFLFPWLLIAKNNNTFKNQNIIIDAIYDFQIAEIRRTKAVNCGANIVDFKDMESYDDTFKRWWDWSYKRILPPEKFEIVKPYIKKGDESDG